MHVRRIYERDRHEEAIAGRSRKLERARVVRQSVVVPALEPGELSPVHVGKREGPRVAGQRCGVHAFVREGPRGLGAVDRAATQLSPTEA
jgi:hypothetical protein